jgi:aminoglycoside phosphotransferase (APT) family kinase protein
MGENPERAGTEGAPAAAVAAFLARSLGDDSWYGARLEAFSGGKSNLTYLVSSPTQKVVLRRPPLGHVLPTAHDMAREYRVLTALAGSAVPVPRPLALCPDESVIGAPFFVMEHVPGHVVRSRWPPGFAARDEDKTLIAHRLIWQLAELHAVDWRAAGLEDWGRPDGFMERQLRRWLRQWDASETRPLPELHELATGLSRAMPRSGDPGIVHGDYRLDNVILDGEEGLGIAAIVDWEMSTIGDPLSDLGVTLAYWPESSDPPAARAALDGIRAPAPRGWPTRSEAAGLYGAASGRSLDDLAFYYAFGFFKLAVIFEGIAHRHLLGMTRGEGFEHTGERVPALVALGLDALEH